MIELGIGIELSDLRLLQQEEPYRYPNLASREFSTVQYYNTGLNSVIDCVTYRAKLGGKEGQTFAGYDPKLKTLVRAVK